MKIVLGIVQKQNKFLLIERAKKEGQLLWAFPGGKVEPTDKTLEDAIIREVFEETNIVCDVKKSLGIKKSDIEIYYYLCQYNSGDIKYNPNEVKNANWYTPNKIFNLVTTPIFEPVKNYLIGFEK